MSKTDKTRPAAVKVLDDPNWLIEHHDHRFGPCDLGPKPTKKADVRWYGSGGTRQLKDGSSEPRCFWWYSTAYWHTPSNNCGCPLCSNQEWRKHQRRRQRHTGRTVARTEHRHAAVVARGAVTSLSDVDDLDGLDDAWYDPWVEEFGNGFEAEVRENARVAASLGLPAGAIVVAVDHRGGPYDIPVDVIDLNEDVVNDPQVAAREYVEVTVLHNNGRREVLSLDETWQEFHTRTG